MTKPGKIEFGDVAEPQVGAGQIRLRVKQIGVCGSDVHVNHGKHPFTSYPVVQGRLSAGELPRSRWETRPQPGRRSSAANAGRVGGAITTSVTC